MDEIPSPLLSPSELDEAIVKIADALDRLGVVYGVVGGAAIALYARHYNLPHRAIQNISIVVQPRDELSAIEISAKLTEKKFEFFFDCWVVKGVRVPRVIVRRLETYGEKKMAVGFKRVDHYAFPDSRLYYKFDLDWFGNRRILWQVGGKNIRFMNAPWLLRQNILAWAERQDVEKKRVDVMDFQSLCDIMEIQKNRAGFRNVGEVEVLRRFVLNMDPDPSSFKPVIDCPEVLGSFWEIRWIIVLWLIIVVLFWDFILIIYTQQMTG